MPPEKVGRLKNKGKSKENREAESKTDLVGPFSVGSSSQNRFLLLSAPDSHFALLSMDDSCGKQRVIALSAPQEASELMGKILREFWHSHPRARIGVAS